MADDSRSRGQWWSQGEWWRGKWWPQGEWWRGGWENNESRSRGQQWEEERPWWQHAGWHATDPPDQGTPWGDTALGDPLGQQAPHSLCRLGATAAYQTTVADQTPAVADQTPAAADQTPAPQAASPAQLRPELARNYKLQMNLRMRHGEMGDLPDGPWGYSIDKYPTPMPSLSLLVKVEVDVGARRDLLEILPTRLMGRNPHIECHPRHDTAFYLMLQMHHRRSVHLDYQIIVFNGMQINTMDQMGTRLSQIFGKASSSEECPVVVQLCFDPQKVNGIRQLLPTPCPLTGKCDLLSKMPLNKKRLAGRTFAHEMHDTQSRFGNE
jgi:hypothetical protein